MKAHFLVRRVRWRAGIGTVDATFFHTTRSITYSETFTLYFFGRDVALTCGGAYLLNLYLVGGVVAV